MEKVARCNVNDYSRGEDEEEYGLQCQKSDLSTNTTLSSLHLI